MQESVGILEMYAVDIRQAEPRYIRVCSSLPNFFAPLFRQWFMNSSFTWELSGHSVDLAKKAYIMVPV